MHSIQDKYIIVAGERPLLLEFLSCSRIHASCMVHGALHQETITWEQDLGQSILIELVVPYDRNTSKWFQNPGAQNSNILISYSREINFGAALRDRIQLNICSQEKLVQI